MTLASTVDVVPLRPYQRDALAAILEAKARGVTRQLVSLPTGAGKTFLAAHLVRELGLRTVFMVHRDELAKQSRAALEQINPAMSIGLVKAESNDVHAGIVVASAQTLARQSRLEATAQRGVQLRGAPPPQREFSGRMQVFAQRAPVRGRQRQQRTEALAARFWP